jgi:NO-binding membrane sensor protein with MHYT domain
MMLDASLAFIEDHSFPLSVSALCICAVTAWLLLVLLDRARREVRAFKARWSAFAALVGGFGVWATHFIATLGYRPDLEFAFDVDRTIESAILGIGLVGMLACPH